MEISEIHLKSSVLYNLVEIGAFYTKGSASWPEVSSAVKKAQQELTGLGHDYAAQQELSDNPGEIDDILDLIENALIAVEQADKMLRTQTPPEEMRPIFSQIEMLNLDLAQLQSQIPLAEIVVDEKPEIDKDQLLEIISERSTEERVLTTNYLAIEKAAQDYASDLMNEAEYFDTLEWMRQLVSASKGELDKFAATIDDWQTETLLQKQLLDEGFILWLNALEDLSMPGCVKDKNENSFTQGMEKAYLANEKLVMAQELTSFLKKGK